MKKEILAIFNITLKFSVFFCFVYFSISHINAGLSNKWPTSPVGSKHAAQELKIEKKNIDEMYAEVELKRARFPGIWYGSLVTVNLY
jgi:hypothetical protein